MCSVPFGCLKLLRMLGGVQQEGLQLAAVRAVAPQEVLPAPISSQRPASASALALTLHSGLPP